MFITKSKCEVCGKIKEGHDCLPVIDVICNSCGAEFHMCNECRQCGCLNCGGKVVMLWASENTHCKGKGLVHSGVTR